MAEQFLTFQQFSSIELANDMAERLSQNNIDFRIEKLAGVLDSTIIGVSSSPDFLIKLKSSDFINAHRVLADYYKELINAIGPDYYLFEFSDKELIEILSKPDEWGAFDYQLAQKILRNRGSEINIEQAQKLKDKRIEELSKPEMGSGLALLGYLFFGYALIISYFMHIHGQYSFPYSVFFVILTGRHLAKNKKVLPNGNQVFSYNEGDRKTGNIITILGVGLLLYSIIIWLAMDIEYSFDIFEYNYFL